MTTLKKYRKNRVYKLTENNKKSLIPSSTKSRSLVKSAPLVTRGIALANKLELRIVLPEQKNTILIVDDDQSFVSILKNSFEKHINFSNYRYMIAFNGFEAFEIYKKYQNEIKLIITGLMMPRMSGMELIDRIHEINHRLPVLVITGSLGTPHYNFYPKNKNIIIMPKPCDMSDVFKNAKTLLKTTSLGETMGK